MLLEISENGPSPCNYHYVFRDGGAELAVVAVLTHVLLELCIGPYEVVDLVLELLDEQWRIAIVATSSLERSGAPPTVRSRVGQT